MERKEIPEKLNVEPNANVSFQILAEAINEIIEYLHWLKINR